MANSTHQLPPIHPKRESGTVEVHQKLRPVPSSVNRLKSPRFTLAILFMSGRSLCRECSSTVTHLELSLPVLGVRCSVVCMDCDWDVLCREEGGCKVLACLPVILSGFVGTNTPNPELVELGRRDTCASASTKPEPDLAAERASSRQLGPRKEFEVTGVWRARTPCNGIRAAGPC